MPSVSFLPSLLDLAFLELDVLARNRVVLLLDHLVGHGARVLLGGVVEAGVRGGNELVLDGDRFGHGGTSECQESGDSQSTGRVGAQPSPERPKVTVCRLKKALRPLRWERTGFPAGADPDSRAACGPHRRCGRSPGAAIRAPRGRRSRSAPPADTGT